MLTAIDVANADAPIFTILFPINIAPKIYLGLLLTFQLISLLLLLLPPYVLFLFYLKTLSAVSDIEKNADNNK